MLDIFGIASDKGKMKGQLIRKEPFREQPEKRGELNG
jgi:hypothetical protein